jgi:hypothetical protein
MLLNYKITFINQYLVTLTNQVSFITGQQDRTAKKLHIVKPYLDLIKIKNEIKEIKASKETILRREINSNNKLDSILNNIKK